MRVFRSLKPRLLSSLFLMLFLLIALITIVTAGILLDRMGNVSEKYLIERSENVANQLDSVISRMEAVSTQILASSTLQEMFLKADKDEYEGKNYFDYHKEDKEIAQDILWTHRTYKESVEAVNIFSKSSYVGMGYSMPTDKIIEITGRECWEIQDGEKYKIMESFQNQWGREQTVLSLIRPFYATTEKMQHIGTIEVQMDNQVIADACDSNTSDLQVLVFDEDSVIYGEKELSPEEIDTYRKERNAIRYSEKEIYTCERLENADWDVLVFQEKEAFQKPMKNIVLISIAGSILISLVVFLILFLVIHRLTKPILQFAEDISNVKDVNQLPKLHTSDITEISVLQNNYIRFVSRIKESQEELLLAKEMELRLRMLVLQEQINPHFLFNSLTAISAVSMEEGGQKVPVMCYQLSNLFRYSSNNVEYVTMEEEVRNLETYLAFMSWRYEENFSFVLEKKGDLQVVTLAKMIFQPLVENCFTHGFKAVMPPYRLEIQCSVDDEGWNFRITDNGNGITEEEVHKIVRKMKNIDQIVSETHEYEMLRTQNMALLNIYIRLVLQYRDRLLFRIKGKSDIGGMEVNITVKDGGEHNIDDQSSDSR